MDFYSIWKIWTCNHNMLLYLVVVSFMSKHVFTSFDPSFKNFFSFLWWNLSKNFMYLFTKIILLTEFAPFEFLFGIAKEEKVWRRDIWGVWRMWSPNKACSFCFFKWDLWIMNFTIIQVQPNFSFVALRPNSIFHLFQRFNDMFYEVGTVECLAFRENIKEVNTMNTSDYCYHDFLDLILASIHYWSFFFRK